MNNEVRAECTSSSESTASTYDKTIDLPHADWSRIKIELWDLNWIDEKMAHSDTDLLRDLAAFDGKSRFMLTDTGGYWAEAAAYIIIEIQWRKDQDWSIIPVDDLRAYGGFIAPGRDW